VAASISGSNFVLVSFQPKLCKTIHKMSYDNLTIILKVDIP
jgi:hypothetical protein